METFGEKLKTLRIMHNLSQRELGQRMGGIKQQTIAQYEKSSQTRDCSKNSRCIGN